MLWVVSREYEEQNDGFENKRNVKKSGINKGSRRIFLFVISHFGYKSIIL